MPMMAFSSEHQRVIMSMKRHIIATLHRTRICVSFEHCHRPAIPLGAAPKNSFRASKMYAFIFPSPNEFLFCCSHFFVVLDCPTCRRRRCRRRPLCVISFPTLLCIYSRRRKERTQDISLMLNDNRDGKKEEVISMAMRSQYWRVNINADECNEEELYCVRRYI